MALDDFFERMQQEVREEIKKKHEQETADLEADRRCRSALRPYALQGMPFRNVVAIEHCPETLFPMYQQLLDETEAERQEKAERQQSEAESAFLKGFLSDT